MRLAVSPFVKLLRSLILDVAGSRQPFTVRVICERSRRPPQPEARDTLQLLDVCLDCKFGILTWRE